MSSFKFIKVHFDNKNSVIKTVICKKLGIDITIFGTSFKVLILFVKLR